ncbi:hypothetical protein C1I95_28925 [Micromonospora craterilacus]|uniref:Uncharacterized protein n=1 Tax=Micromonospora craterilacus TaxID=1655439 RepID=A0A2W2EC28_9ACTN|nr:hypothetical protein [Micromonospora craterilacus]PZG09528.1 hypothetical protein C1I95_28925 [Micromonospora craterilacus]
MATWAARVEFDQVITVETAEEAVDLFGGSVSIHGDRNRTGFAFEVEGVNLFQAVDAARRRAYEVAGFTASRHGGKGRPPMLAEFHVGTYSDMAAATFGVKDLPLVGLAEILRMAGGKVSREAVRQWAQREDFPAIMGRVSGNPAYYRPEVEDFLESIGRLEAERLDVDWMFRQVAGRD